MLMGFIANIIMINLQWKADHSLIINTIRLNIVFIFLSLMADNIYLIAVFLGISFNFASVYFYSNIFVFIFRNIDATTYTIIPSLYNSIYSMTGCLLALIAWVFNSDWRIICGIFGLLQTYLLIKFQELSHKDLQETTQNESVEVLSFLRSNKEIAYNALVHIMEKNLMQAICLYLLFMV